MKDLMNKLNSITTKNKYLKNKKITPNSKNPLIMKAIKFIFATLVLSIVLVSCSATAVSEDDELYNVEEVQATGAEGAEEVIRSRE